ncbi:hypothetical protein ACFL96_05965 [Thermoproteota archaeon]
MIDELEKLKKKVKKQFEKDVEVDPDSDIIVHEKFVKQKKVRHLGDEESKEEEE